MMIHSMSETVISDRYIPELAYRNDSTSLVIISDNADKNQFMFDTALYYVEKEIPVVFVTDNPDEIAEAFSTFSDADRVLESENCTYHTGTLDNLVSLLTIAEEKRKVRPVVICIKDLPDEPTEETDELFRFADTVKSLFTQVYLFAPDFYDYFNNINNRAELEYFRNTEKNIMKVQFLDYLLLDIEIG